MQENWRVVPAETVVRVIMDYNEGKYPPSYPDLVSIACRVGYSVHEVSNALVPDALTNHKNHTIYVAQSTTGQMIACLLHEVAEILLKLPVAAEYHYVPSASDEHHEVAKLVEQDRRQILSHQVEEADTHLQTLEEQIKALQQQAALEVKRRKALQMQLD